MGQRHQIFVVAKVNGVYRCLGAIHHQWLYGFTALKRCLALLKIFEAPENRFLIEQELLYAHRRADYLWDQDVDDGPDQDFVPFPFIVTCLIVGASFGPSEGYHHNVSIEPWGMAYDEGDNNNGSYLCFVSRNPLSNGNFSGLTIIDITEPSNVSYCFLDFFGMESQEKVPLMTPLPAYDYLNAYYPSPDAKLSERHAGVLKEFKKCKLLSVDVLRNTWPEGEWKEPEEIPTSLDLANLQDALHSEVRSLECQTVDNLVDSLVNQPDNIDSSSISRAMLVGSFLPRLKVKLYELASSFKPTKASIVLLVKVLEREKIVDMGPFAHLPAEFISDVLQELQKRCRMTSLSLSNSNLDGKDLLEILTVCPNLWTIYLLGMTNASPESVRSALELTQTKVQEVYHTDVLVNSLSKMHPCREGTEPVKGLNLKGPVVNLVWVSVHYKEERPIKWSKLVPVKARAHRMMQDRRMKYLSFSLPKAPCLDIRVLDGLLNAFCYASRASTEYNDMANILAMSFAIGKPSVHSTSNCCVRSLSSSFWDNDRQTTDKIVLMEGEFATIAIDDCYDCMDQDFVNSLLSDQTKGKDGELAPSEIPTKRVRYALVTPKADGEGFEIMDVPEFLDQKQQTDNVDTPQDLGAYWTQQVKNLGGISFCTADEALAVADEVFDKWSSANDGSI